ncbi:MAG: DUF2933 domain-containing protein [Lewinellaceae bacterium]|nr:DUF2933 domain-containing protein [Lewinella sp.]MCB9280032.1 DUF2933 domain-containing protein [Lewinellaceae bacterium]
MPRRASKIFNPVWPWAFFLATPFMMLFRVK